MTSNTREIPLVVACCGCNRLLGLDGTYEEAYLVREGDAVVSHGICDECTWWFYDVGEGPARPLSSDGPRVETQSGGEGTIWIQS